MDPQAALDDLIDILDALGDERRNARYQAQQLLRWMSHGGFPPPVIPENLAFIECLATSAGFARPADMPPAQDPITLRDLLNRIAHD